MKIPTKYDTYEELILDLNILGKILQVPSQTIEELTVSLKNEYRMKRPMPTLEQKKYEISSEVATDYEITHEEELVLGEDEVLVDLTLHQDDIPDIDESIINVSEETRVYFHYENQVTPSMLEEFLQGDYHRFRGKVPSLGGSPTDQSHVLSDEQIEEMSSTMETWGSGGLDFDTTSYDTEEEMEDNTDESDSTLFEVDEGLDLDEPESSIEHEEPLILNKLDLDSGNITEDDDGTEFDYGFGIEDYDYEPEGGIDDDSDTDELFDDEEDPDEYDEDLIDDSSLDEELEDSEDSDYSDDEFSEEDDIPDEDSDDYDEDLIDDVSDEDSDYPDDEFSEEDDIPDEDSEDYDEDYDEDLIDDSEEDDLFDEDEVSEPYEISTPEQKVSEVDQKKADSTLKSYKDDLLEDSDLYDSMFEDKSTVSKSAKKEEDDAVSSDFLTRIISDKSLSDKQKQEIIASYYSRDKVTTKSDFGKTTIQDEHRKELKDNDEEAVYKSIRQYVRMHPRCPVSEVLQYFSRAELEKEIMVGKVIRKGNTLHI